ncbi:adenosine deaminase [Saccharothrix violaceirubra]|uniref:adenosine deaminase n=1 Tax=Saccharothrix violaceirubra TaxID=413306 RepID=A0A7W7WTT5_9PSEU|nr:adenosine deaminase [Saccharothrix violaceirubra]MBB4963062.1 adenosine deaminase [Saccharothrix violaceirubra]
MASLTPEVLRAAPKVLLHDHLDGGLRPSTVIELAEESGHQGLPTTDPEALGDWFRDNADSGSLVRYLEGFAHTCGVMQDEAALVRVASEAAQDLADDGVVYAEIRYAPELFTDKGLSLAQAVEAVQEGFRQGEAASGNRIRVGTLLCAMRQNDDWQRIADLVVRYRDAGVVGFDIAGPELGFPPTRELSAFEYLRRENAHFTIHAGEADGPESIHQAVQYAGAERLGHGVRLIEDVRGDEVGHLAAYVRDRRIALEMCPTSNVHTGAVASLAEHPIKRLDELGFRVTVNTDNRLMSRVSLSGEFGVLVDRFGFGLDDLRRFTVNAAKAAFLPLDDRRSIIQDIVEPGYAALSR